MHLTASPTQRSFGNQVLNDGSNPVSIFSSKSLDPEKTRDSLWQGLLYYAELVFDQIENCQRNLDAGDVLDRPPHGIHRQTKRFKLMAWFVVEGRSRIASNGAAPFPGTQGAFDVYITMDGAFSFDDFCDRPGEGT